MLGCISGSFTALTYTDDGTEPLPCGHLLFTTSCVDLLGICVHLLEPSHGTALQGVYPGQGLRHTLQLFSPALWLIHLALAGRAADALNLGPPMPGKYPATESQPLPVCLVGLVFVF